MLPATRSRGNSSRTIPNASGKMPPPAPWITRPTIIRTERARQRRDQDPDGQDDRASPAAAAPCRTCRRDGRGSTVAHRCREQVTGQQPGHPRLVRVQAVLQIGQGGDDRRAQHRVGEAGERGDREDQIGMDSMVSMRAPVDTTGYSSGMIIPVDRSRGVPPAADGWTTLDAGGQARAAADGRHRGLRPRRPRRADERRRRRRGRRRRERLPALFESKRELLAALVVRRMEQIAAATEEADLRSRATAGGAHRDADRSSSSAQRADFLIGEARAVVADRPDVMAAVARATEAQERLLAAARAEGRLRGGRDHARPAAAVRRHAGGPPRRARPVAADARADDRRARRARQR